MLAQIRRGGVETSKGFLFELSGGDVSLDFANTIDCRPLKECRDLIPDFPKFLSWARQTKIISRKEEQKLLEKAEAHYAEAESARRDAIRLRELLFEIFSAVADKKRIPETSISKWNEWISKASEHYELQPSATGFRWALKSEHSDFRSILWPIVHASAELLTGSDASRIRKCASKSCDWLFLDRSKRGNRRWCDMTVCGNREKARRYYHKSKGE